ncbi:NUDIX hydrolase [Granulicoccus sp. GXG6511]|uniref:NUDIX hydrolase n=1 Tax=Granulicoccus sp. GXG6511 TaxID=3381351 RepID=UPI003D7D5275
MAEHPARAALSADCLAALSAYAPDEASQRSLRDDFVDHLRSRGDGWSRSCPGAHLTASAIISSPSADRFLLIRHRKLDRWLQTGGHIEATDATLSDAALREAREESGLADLELVPGILHLDRHDVPCGTVRPAYHLDVRYLILARSPGRLTATEEVQDVRWFGPDELPTDEESVTVLVDLARHRLVRAGGQTG